MPFEQSVQEGSPSPNPISFPLLILSPTHIQDSAETVLALGSTVRLKPE